MAPSVHPMSKFHPHMRCQKCRYPLEGLGTGSCPECGRPFDPNDPRTYLSWPTSGQRLARVALCVWFVINLGAFGAAMGGLMGISLVGFRSCVTGVGDVGSMGSVPDVPGARASCRTGWSNLARQQKDSDPVACPVAHELFHFIRLQRVLESD